jgi:succinyl-diaminopimelate desuccinylase
MENAVTNEDRIFAYIESSWPAMVELEALLTAIPAIAPEFGGDGEYKKAAALERWLRNRGFSDIMRYDAPDPRVSSGRRPNLVATIGGIEDSRLWIISHIDVVPEGGRDMWKSDPFKLEFHDGAVWGRGVEDDQQGIVSSIFAALTFLDTGIKPRRTLKLLFVADEESGSVHGMQYLLKSEKLFRKDDFIVIPDGGNSRGTNIEVAEKSILWMKILTKGKQSHAAVPDQGVNAFLAASDLALRLHAMESEVCRERDDLFEPDRSTINPTKKEANVQNINTIPGDDVFDVDMRILPRYPLDLIIEESEKRMRAIEKTYDVVVSYEILQRNESRATAVDSPVVEPLSEAIRGTYLVEPKTMGVGGGTVGAYLRRSDFDVVIWCRQDGTAHQPNENASVANIVGDAKVFALLASGR